MLRRQVRFEIANLRIAAILKLADDNPPNTSSAAPAPLAPKTFASVDVERFSQSLTASKLRKCLRESSKQKIFDFCKRICLLNPKTKLILSIETSTVSHKTSSIYAILKLSK